MARIPFVERSYGQDELARRHRLVGFTSVNLLGAHIVLITLGYAASTTLGLWGTIVDVVLHYPGMLLAVAGTVALCMVVVTSVRKARGRLRYESWHLLHLYAYLGAGLALPHQLWTGQDFVGNLPATVFWWGLYAVAVGSVVWFRVLQPLLLNLRHRLVVAEVRPEGPGVTSVVVVGRELDRFGARAGQFLHWRFLDAPGWSRAHPYSLSAAPDGRSLRITAAHVGDGSSALRSLRPGSRVHVEGPYGRLHAGIRRRQKVLLMASGIGVTPMRALLEELPQGPGDVVLVYRVHSLDQVVFGDELSALAQSRGRLFSPSPVRACEPVPAGCPSRQVTSATSRPCVTSCPTWPSGRFSSAETPSGRTSSSRQPGKRASRTSTSTSSTSPTERRPHSSHPAPDPRPPVPRRLAPKGPQTCDASSPGH